MNTTFRFLGGRRSASLVALLAVCFTFSSCSKQVTAADPLPAAAPAATDANAGSWKMIVLTGPAQVPVPAPAATNDPGYLSELAAIKTAQASLTDAQRQNITYWSAGGVLRWNQILRELVARADLPPAPNPDGSYPVPNQANPFADPQYPFSNPPYAARAYSYVSVAQYDALKAAWYYKYQYNRPSPFQVDKSIQSLLPITNLPAYPSEDAVLSVVNAELLKLLFPTSVAEITQHEKDQQQAALLSGRASTSDIAAGVALGESVYKLFSARAAADGMKAAGGNAALWASLAAKATAQGEIPWISQDIPARPPMLPAFGNVKTWFIPASKIPVERPGPPPSTSSAQMQTELAEVKAAVNNATRDQLATVYKWADGVSTVTPSGHWNAIAEPYIVAGNFSEVRAARTYALINTALMDAAVGCWDTKYTYFNPRPIQLDASIKTDIAMPNFPSYESGHSTFSSAAATVLSYVFPSAADSFTAQRDEAAMSRLYAGIHFRSDITAGISHGQRIAAYTLTFAKEDGAQ